MSLMTFPFSLNFQRIEKCTVWWMATFLHHDTRCLHFKYICSPYDTLMTATATVSLPLLRPVNWLIDRVTTCRWEIHMTESTDDMCSDDDSVKNTRATIRRSHCWVNFNLLQGIYLARNFHLCMCPSPHTVKIENLLPLGLLVSRLLCKLDACDSRHSWLFSIWPEITSCSFFVHTMHCFTRSNSNALSSALSSALSNASSSQAQASCRQQWLVRNLLFTITVILFVYSVSMSIAFTLCHCENTN